jgi:hypothetical protein
MLDASLAAMMQDSSPLSGVFWTTSVAWTISISSAPLEPFMPSPSQLRAPPSTFSVVCSATDTASHPRPPPPCARSAPRRRPPKPKPRRADVATTIGSTSRLGVALWSLAHPELLAHGVEVRQPHRLPLLQISSSHRTTDVEPIRSGESPSLPACRAQILCGLARTCFSDPPTHSSDPPTRSSDPRGDDFGLWCRDGDQQECGHPRGGGSEGEDGVQAGWLQARVPRPTRG